VESGVKYHKPKPEHILHQICDSLTGNTYLKVFIVWYSNS